MRRVSSLIVILLLTLVLINSTFAQTCTSPSLITDPEAFVWDFVPASGSTEAYYTGTIEITEASLCVGSDMITTRIYKQPGGADGIPGPTISMVPGNKYVLRFENKLPYEAPEAVHNVFKDPNISNIHTHGLHISGETPGDDVTRSFEGGFGGDFVYDILNEHMGGTFWYHAHHHGSTFLQVSAGAFGLMIIDDSADPKPANVTAMVERHLVIGYLDPGVAGTGGDTLISGSLAPTWTVNGRVVGDLNMPPDTWQHWRILLADRDARDKTLSFGPQCEVALMARDGVWRTSVPKILTTNDITMTAASRGDFAVRCNGNSDIRVNNEIVANVIVTGLPGSSAAHPFDTDGVSTWDSVRPDYLRDLRGEEVQNTQSINMGARTINGSKFDADVPTFTRSYGGIGVESWTLKGARQHPFHLHIYHVQMDSACGDFEDGEYYDVVSGNCSIRLDLSDSNPTVYEGRTIMHCHILEHEDQGAMGWMDVLGGLSAPTYPAGTAFSPYYQIDNNGGGTAPLAPTNLSAIAVSSSQINLGWTDNSDNEFGFEIERSLDGVTFTQLATVSAETISYSDANLAAETAYTYQVRATNSVGTSDYSNIASATTDAATVGTLVQVRTITLSTVSQGKGNKSGRAVVVAEDDQGNLVSNATVSGTFSGSFNEAGSGVTDANGSTTIDTSATAKGGVSFTFCVNTITVANLTDYAGPDVCTSF